MSMSQYLPLVPPFLFGLALQRGRVHEGSIVMGQMTFSHFVMLKMFLSALGTSFLASSYYFKTRIGGSTPEDEAKREKMYQRGTRGINAVIAGTALVGVGMALSGSCPGTVYAQIGALAWTAIPIIFGALAGAIAFEQWMALTPATASAQPNKSELSINTPLADLIMHGGFIPKEQNALHKIINAKFQLNLKPEEFMQYAGAGLLAFTALLELLVNWKYDLRNLYPDTWQDLSIFTAQPALVSGLMIGAAQLISLYNFDKQLGCSMTFLELGQLFYSYAHPRLYGLNNPKVSQVCDQVCDYTCEAIKNPQVAPKPMTAYGITLGALLGLITSGSLYVGRNSLDFPNHSFIVLFFRLFLGGFLAVLGARIAGGCTSGIGLSYTSTGSTTGAIGMCCMFGAAIVTGIILKIVGFGY